MRVRSCTPGATAISLGLSMLVISRAVRSRSLWSTKVMRSSPMWVAIERKGLSLPASVMMYSISGTSRMTIASI